MKYLLFAFLFLGASVLTASPITVIGLDATGSTNSDTAHALFLGMLSGSTTDSIESATVAFDVPSIALNFGLAGTATMTPNSSISVIGSSIFPGGGSRSVNSEPGGWTISFANPVAAFGFYFGDMFSVYEQNSGSPVTIIATLTKQGGGSETINIAPRDYGFTSQIGVAIGFLGIVDPSATYTAIAFSHPEVFASDKFHADLFTAATSQQVIVPEPSTALLLAGALGALAVLRRR